MEMPRLHLSRRRAGSFAKIKALFARIQSVSLTASHRSERQASNHVLSGTGSRPSQLAANNRASALPVHPKYKRNSRHPGNQAQVVCFASCPSTQAEPRTDHLSTPGPLGAKRGK